MVTYYRYTDRHGIRTKKVSALERTPLRCFDTPEEAITDSMQRYAEQEIIAANKLKRAAKALRESKEITEK